MDFSGFDRDTLVKFRDAVENKDFSGFSRDELLQFRSALSGVPMPEVEEMGPFGAGWEQSAAAVDTGVARLLYGMDFDDAAKRYEESAAARTQEVQERFKPDVQSYTDVGGLADAGEYVYNLLGQSATETGAGMAGALLAGTGLGVARGAPLGPVGMAASGIAGAGMALYPFFFGRNISRQAEEQDIPVKETDATKAAIAALPQSTLDAVLDTFIVGKIIPQGVVTRVLQQEGKKGLRKVAGRFLANAVKGGLIEAPTETTQQLIEILQSGNWEGLTPEVQKELSEAAVGGLVLGGLLGGTAGTIFTEPTPQVEVDPAEADRKEGELQRAQGLASLGQFGLVNTDEGVVRPPDPREPVAPPKQIEPPTPDEGQYPIKPPRRRNFKQPDPKAAQAQTNMETLQAAREASTPVVPEPLTSFPESVQQRIRQKRIQTGSVANPDAPVTIDEIRGLYGDTAAEEFIKMQKPLTQGTGAIPQPTVEETIDLPPTIQVDDVTYDIAQRTVQGSGKVDFDEVKLALEDKVGTKVDDSMVRQALAAMVLRGLVTDRTGRVQRAAEEGRDIGEAVARGQGLRPSDTLGQERKPTELPPGTQRRFQIETRPVETRDGGDWTFEIEGAPARETFPTKKAASEAASAVQEQRGLKKKPRLLKAREDVVITEQALDDQGQMVGSIVRRAYTPENTQQVDALRQVMGRSKEGFGSPEEARRVINSVMPIPGMDRGARARLEAEEIAKGYRERVEKPLKALRDQLNTMGLSDVGLRLQNVMLDPEGFTVEGSAIPGLITIATDIYSQNLSEAQLMQKLAGVMNHEVIHALRDLGVLTEAEFKTLFDAAQKRKRPNGQTYSDWASQYQGMPGYTQEDIAEEAVAEMFREWSADPKNVTGRPASIFQKITDFLRRLGNWMSSNGFQTADDIMKAIRSGEVGGRERGATREEQQRYARRDAARQRMTGTSTVGFFRDPMRISDGRPNLRQIGEVLDSVVPTRDLTNAHSRAAAVRGITDEMAFQRKRNRSGEGWYDSDISLMFDRLSQVFPEFSHPDPGVKDMMRQMFLIVAGPMSNGRKAAMNVENAAVAWGYFKKYGDLPGKNPYTKEGWGGDRSKTIAQHLGLINRMLADPMFNQGNQPAMLNLADWMFSIRSGREITEVRKKYGFSGPPKDVRLTKEYPGAYIFGPKLGAFIMNLNGFPDETVDKWAARSIYRHFGQLSDPNAKEGIKDGVAGKDREIMKSIIRDVAARVGVESRDLQAMLWFYEKDLYNTFGTTIPLETFSDGAEQFTKRYGNLFQGDRSPEARFRLSKRSVPSAKDAAERGRSEADTGRGSERQLRGVRAEAEEPVARGEGGVREERPDVRNEVVDGAVLQGDGRGFTDFFADVTRGSKTHTPQNLAYYSPAIIMEDDTKGFAELRESYSGNFDDHIKTSIPGFDEVQNAVGDAITKTYKGSAKMLDIGSSEGALIKAISAKTDGRIKTVGVDPNPAMVKTFNDKDTPKGSETVLAAFGSAEEAGELAWVEGDETEINFYDPKDEKFDVVHEAMVFQFISNARNAQLARAKEMMKKDGILIIEEKFGNNAAVYNQNEAKKDDYKRLYYSEDQIQKKAAQVLKTGEDAVEGMTGLQVTQAEAEAILKQLFGNVVQFWDSGNFKGYAASDDAKALNKFIGNLQPLTSDYETVRTPRQVKGEAGNAVRYSFRRQVKNLPAMSYFDGPQVDAQIDETLNPKSRTTLVMMTPDEYIAMATPGLRNPGQQDVYAEQLQRGLVMDNIPSLTIKGGTGGNEAKVIGHNGRHRAHAMSIMKIAQMPVRITHEPDEREVRWGVTPVEDRPAVMRGQDGTSVMDMPDSVIYPRDDKNLPPQKDGEGDRRFLTGLAFSQERLEAEQERLAAEWEAQKGFPLPLGKRSMFNRYIAPEFMEAPARLAQAAGGMVFNAQSIGMYAGLEKLEVSTSFTTIYPPKVPQSSINRVAAEVFQVAKDHNQDDAFVAEDMGLTYDGPDGRPGLNVFFRPQGGGTSGRTESEVRQIIADITSKVIGGFTAYRATVNNGAQGYEGLMFIWMPEYAGVAPSELDTNFDDVLRTFKQIDDYVNENGIGSTRTSMYKAILGHRGNYDQIIEELRAEGNAGERGKAGPWGEPVRTSVETRYRGQEGRRRGSGKSRYSKRFPQGLVKPGVKPRFSLKGRGTRVQYNLETVSGWEVGKGGRIDLQDMALAMHDATGNEEWLEYAESFKDDDVVHIISGRFNSEDASLKGRFTFSMSPDGKLGYVAYIELYDANAFRKVIEEAENLTVSYRYGDYVLQGTRISYDEQGTRLRKDFELPLNESSEAEFAKVFDKASQGRRRFEVTSDMVTPFTWDIPAMDWHQEGIPGFGDVLSASDWISFARSFKSVAPKLEYILGERQSGAKYDNNVENLYQVIKVGRLEADGNYELKEGWKGQFGPRYSRRATQVPVDNQAIIKKIVGKEERPGFMRAFANKLFGVAKGESIKDALLRNSFNAFAPAYNVDRMLNNGVIPMNHTSVGRGLEMAMQTSGRMQGLLELGPITYNKETGELHFKRDLGGLYDVFERIGERDKEYFQAYAVAKREMALRQAGRKGFFNLQYDEMKSLIEGAPEHFEEVYEDYQKFNDAMVDLAVDTGLMQREKAEELKSLFYTPFYRMMEDDLMEAPAYVLGPRMQAAINNPKSALDVELEGGEQPLGDFYENIIKNYQSIMTASLKNTALNRVANAIDRLNELGMFEIGEQVGKNRKSKPAGDRIMSFRRDGQPIFYDIQDAPLWISIASMAPPQRNAIVEAASKFAAVLRAGVTLSPGFMLANLWRGKISAYVTTDTPLEPGILTLKGFKDALKEGPSTEAIKAMTGIGGYTYGMGERSFTSEFARRMRRKEGGGYGFVRDWGDRFMSGVKALENVGEATEMAERVALYEHLVKRGVDEKDAAFEAMNLVNFGRRGAGQGVLGATLTALIPMVPFLNARLQGLYRIVENQKGQRRIIGIPMQTFVRGMVITAASSAIYSMFSDDERWKDEPLDRKINYDIMYMGDKTIYLPRAFEVGSIFASLPVLFYDAIREKDGGDMAKGTAMMVFNTFAINPIPQMALPAIEVLTNFNTFTAAPVESLAETRMLPSDRYNDRTSGLAKMVGSVTGALKEETGVGLSPIQLDHLFSGYLGSMGTMFLGMTDSLLGAWGVIPDKPAGLFGDPHSPAGIVGQALNIDRFVKTDEQRPSKFIRDFYQLRAEADQAYSSYQEAVLRGDRERAQQILEEKRAPLAVRKTVGRIGRQIADVNRAMRMIRYNPTMSSEEKARRLKPLIETKRRLAEQGATLGARLGL